MQGGTITLATPSTVGMIGQSRWGGCKGTSTVVSVTPCAVALTQSHQRLARRGTDREGGASLAAACAATRAAAPSESPESPVGPTGTERNGTERNGTERNGTERMHNLAAR